MKEYTGKQSNKACVGTIDKGTN